MSGRRPCGFGQAMPLPRRTADNARRVKHLRVVRPQAFATAKEAELSARSSGYSGKKPVKEIKSA
jgi:hypothetical protein